MAKHKHNRGQFKRGFDARRHQLTAADRVKGFWNAIYSIVERHPEAIGADGKHMACRFLKSKREKNR